MTNLRWCVALAVAIVASASAPAAALASRGAPPLVPAAADWLSQARLRCWEASWPGPAYSCYG